MDIRGYERAEELLRTGPYTVFRGRRSRDGQPVLVKTPAGEARAADVEALQREFDLLRELTISGVPSARELIRLGDLACLVLEDSGHRSVRELLDGGRLDLSSCLRITIELCTTLSQLHARGVTCGSVNPASMLISADLGQVQLVNFTLASRPSVEGRTAALPAAGSAATYASPEQTGRTNRPVDYRTDFYSLGATLYELLTGRPPFESEDPLELIHSHIAKTPLPPSAIVSEVPEQVSRIVMRLLAKSAEDRYQSAAGIKHDLEVCQREWSTSHTISSFDLGQRDVSDRFLIPQRLYGRDREVAELMGAFDETCDGATALMLVSGYSGIGKTSLINELCKPIVGQRGYFTTGKFDQVVRNIPYGALIQALRGLVSQLLTESEDRLSEWRARLSEALGPNGGVLSEVIPEIEFIVGKQPPPRPLDPVEAQNRFRYVFQSFVGALAQREHPLIVFLDDLQWVDTATLDLLHALLTEPDIHHLLFIGAYRDNEVDAGHPLTWATDRLEASGANVHRVSLGPLTLSDLVAFLDDTLHGDRTEVESLARLLLQKTDGNPFFVIQFLKALQQESLFDFDRERGRWTFQIDAITALGITDNVIDLMTRKIRRLSARGQGVLTLAACIGNPFEWRTFLTVSRQSTDEVKAGLAEALEAGLIHESGTPYDGSDARQPAGTTYAFLHDRVQQAAYGLIPEEQKKPVHLDVGRLLVAQCGSEVPDDRLFEIVSHLNTGSALIADPAERIGVARLNLAAGRKAKTSAAYEAASAYLDAGIALLSDDRWDTDYELMFSLHLEAAECHYLARRFDTAEDYFERLLARALTPLDQAQVHRLRIILYENLSHYRQAASSGREGLSLFGISLPERDADAQAALDAEIDAIQRLLGDRPIASLIDLPMMRDANVGMVMRILTSLWSPSYITGNQLVARLISATMVRLSLAHGNTEDSAYGYVTHAITVGPIIGDYRSAYEWGELALKVNERFDDAKRRAKIHQQFHAHVKLWRQPFASCIPHAREARRSGLQAGDLNYAGYGAVTETWPALPISNSLDRFVREYEPAASLLEKLKLSDFLAALRVMLNWALALQGRTAARLSLSDAHFDEEAFIAKFEDEPFFRTFFYTAKLHLCVLLEETQPALEAARRARAGTLTGTIWPVLVDFWGGLALTGAFTEATNERQADYWSRLVSAQTSLRDLAENCPENFRCFWLLLSGEMKRVAAHPEEAVTLCEEALAYARQTDNLQQEALANELCARAWLACGDEPLAARFLKDARRGYRAWGASVKVKQLEEKHGRLLVTRLPATTAEHAAAVRATSSPESVSLDMATVLKVAHAIAVEIELEDLLRTLMKIALENAGAERGTFLQEREGRLFVEAEAVADPAQVHVRPMIPWEQAGDLAPSVVRYVHRTGQDVVVGNAATDDRFASDPYIHEVGAKSILCVRVGHQGRLGGLLYLENNLTAEAFTRERTETMRVLAVQAAISLENARLYDEMKREAIWRRRAEEMVRAVTEGTASVTGKDFFDRVVRCLAEALHVQYTFVAECREPKTRARTLAFWKANCLGDNFEYDVADTPCRAVLQGTVSHHSEQVQQLFPNDRDLVALGAESYLAVPIFDTSGVVIGHMAVLDTRPLPEDPLHTSVLRIFAARAGAELQRLWAEEGLRKALTEVETLKNQLQAENIYLQEEIRTQHNFNEIIGNSAALLEALHKVERVAPTESTVLIVGETGSGKELFARAVHSRSKRNDRPLVKVNCGAIAPGLVESELFGHVKGAFTGAIEKRLGRFEVANGGTILLDEVGELPLEAQVKLLRVLQEQEFEPVGSSRTVRVNVRVIAATNRNLEQALREGRFRADLLYRLNVFPIEVPPLRQRTSDIGLLAGFLVSGLARKLGKPIQGFSARSMELLMTYAWPGNVRELQNVVERAAILAQGPVLEIDRGLLGAQPAVVAGGPAPTNDETLDQIQRTHILRVLTATGGVVEGTRGAATILGLHPNTLRSRMKKLGILPASPRAQ